MKYVSEKLQIYTSNLLIQIILEHKLQQISFLDLFLISFPGFFFNSRLQPSSAIAFRNFEEESKRPAVWESDQSAASTANGSRDNLASLYRPPFTLMFQGTFEKVIQPLL